MAKTTETHVQPGQGKVLSTSSESQSTAPIPANDPSIPRPIISPPGSVLLPDIITGCKVFVDRPNEPKPRKAEILSIRSRKLSRAARRAVALGDEPAEANIPDEEKLEYYVHYVEFNKRLDEWIPGTRILLSYEVEWPLPPALAQAAGTPGHSHGSPAPASPAVAPTNKRLASSTSISGASTPARDPTPPPFKKAQEASSMLRKAAVKAAAVAASAIRKKRKAVQIEEEEDDEDADGEADEDGDSEMTGDRGDEDADGDDDQMNIDDDDLPHTFSKAQEIEKLRTQGSMTQSHSEVSRVKNLDKIQMGKHEVEAWYFSPYPIEHAHIPVMHICGFCLSFFASEKQIERHRKKCTLLHPPGNEIYRHEEISFFEIDGRKQKTWCRNLCLLSKCFLDHKTLYYDVDPFLFYVMCSRDDTGVHLIGYFSKEKESAESYNVACILTLPQYQRMGYGKLLIEFSYELSKKEQKLGSPEKPLSDLGLLSYRAYWAETVVDLLLSARDDVSIEELAQKAAIVQGDIMHTCQALQMLKLSKGQYQLVVSEAVIEQFERAKKKGRRRIVPSALKWKPPVFSRNDLRFGF